MPNFVVEACVNEGHWICLQRARRLGYPWPDKIICVPRTSGQLQCLLYALKQGCHLDYRSLLDASECFFLHTLPAARLRTLFRHCQGYF